MKHLQQFKSYFAQLLLKHHLLLLLLLGASAIIFEVLEHWGEADSVDIHYVREVLFFGLFYPLAVSLLLRLLLRTQEQQNYIIRQRALEQQLYQELITAPSWADLTHLIVNFPATIAPVSGASLLRYTHEHENAELELIADSWSNHHEIPSNFPTPILNSGCGLSEHRPDHDLHLFTRNITPWCSYCLPLWRHKRLVGLLHLHLPASHHLTFDQINLLNHLSPIIALSIDTTAPENPEFLQTAAAQTERTHVARQLHNTLGQNLSYLRLKLDQLTMNKPPPHLVDIWQDLERMRDTADEAYEQLKQTIHTLQPENQYHLTELLVSQAQTVAQTANFTLHTQLKGDPQPLPPLVHRKIIFVFREALTNIHRHAQAKQVELTVHWSQDNLTINLTDDGIGFIPAQSPAYGHFGILIMHQRAKEINGHLSIRSRPDQGTTIILHYPIPTLRIVQE